MKETSFINQNKEKWRKFENTYKANNHNPDELSNLFVEITEDLSYARTHYPKRTVRVYLNNLAQDVFTSLYRIKNRPFARFIQFWTKSLPLEAYRMRKDMLVALLIFVISAFIGVISTSNDIRYAEVILGPGYVSMTNNHIDEWVKEQEKLEKQSRNGSSTELSYIKLKPGEFSGSPLKVYETMESWPMFSYIFFNNIRVSFFMFILGLIFGIGTLFFLVYNGIMVGTFQSYFYFKGLIVGHGLFYATFLTIWIHGAFEITGIVLAAACGFSLGRSLMFPKTLTRLQSLQQGAKRGLKVFIGISVFIFLAAILESWVTRQYNMPEKYKLMIILGSFFIMFVVFVLIPFRVARKYPNEIEVNENPTFNATVNFSLYAIRNIADVMTDTFRLYRRHYKTSSSILIKVLLPLSFIFIYFNYTQNEYFYDSTNPWYTTVMLLFGVSPFDWILPVVFWPMVTGIFLAHVFYNIQKKEDPEFAIANYRRFMLIKSIEITALFLPISLAYQFGPGWLMIIIMFAFPMYMPAIYGITHLKGNFISRFSQGISTGAQGYANGMAVYFFIIILCAIFLGLFTFQIYWITEEFIRWHLETRFEHFQGILQVIKSIFFVVFYFHMIKLIMVSFTLLYYHVIETQTSKGLFAKLDAIGKNNKYYESTSED